MLSPLNLTCQSNVSFLNQRKAKLYCAHVLLRTEHPKPKSIYFSSKLGKGNCTLAIKPHFLFRGVEILATQK